MNAHFSNQRYQPRIYFAPGDQVIRYCGGQPFFCTVMEVRGDDCLRVCCPLWPSGYSALVTGSELVLVARSEAAQVTAF